MKLILLFLIQFTISFPIVLPVVKWVTFGLAVGEQFKAGQSVASTRLGSSLVQGIQAKSMQLYPSMAGLAKASAAKPLDQSTVTGLLARGAASKAVKALQNTANTLVDPVQLSKHALDRLAQVEGPVGDTIVIARSHLKKAEQKMNQKISNLLQDREPRK